MRSSPFFACLALVVTARESAAFDFSEHAHFTARAVALLADEDARYRELLGGIGALLDSRLLCQGDALFMEAPENCFGLADIAGLAGDHAGSPPLVVWRWFDDLARSRPQRLRLFEIIADTGAWIEPPDESAFRVPARTRFLTYMRRFAPRYWPAVRPDDNALLALDDSYMNVILRMPAHFRPRIRRSFDDELPQLASERFERHPKPHAFAWYADMHLGALTLAALSRGGDARLRAAALVLELTALHYLQDAVAPGHISADSALGPASTSLTHDRDNYGGMLVAVPEGLCAGLDKPPGVLAVSPLCTPREALETATFEHLKCQEIAHMMTVPGQCRAMSFDSVTDPGEGNTRNVVLYGDGVVASQGRLYGVPYESVRAVDDWATSLSYLSLREVLREATRPGPCADDRQWPCDWRMPEAAKIHRHEAFQTLVERRRKGDDGARYEALVAWWEGIGESQKTRAARIREGFGKGRFEALRYVPTMAVDNREHEPIEMMSGHTVTVRFGFLHAFDGRHSRYPDTWSQPLPETRLAYRVVAPRVPVILELGFDVANLRGDDHEGIATHLLFGAGWSFDGVAYAQAGLALGWLWPAADFSQPGSPDRSLAAARTPRSTAPARGRSHRRSSRRSPSSRSWRGSPGAAPIR